MWQFLDDGWWLAHFASNPNESEADIFESEADSFESEADRKFSFESHLGVHNTQNTG